METFMLMTCREGQLGFLETVFLNTLYNHFLQSSIALRTKWGGGGRTSEVLLK
jgi:hypothetical protein